MIRNKNNRAKLGRIRDRNLSEIDPADHLPDYKPPGADRRACSGNVDIWRDDWGIPHVKASSYQDAFAGLGFAQAQDRLWQMEALLRRGTGRYAEWLGARAVAGDIIARQMDTARRLAAGFCRCSATRPRRCSKPMRAASTPSSRSAAGRSNTSILDCEPARLGALALDRGHAPDRLSDGIGVVEIVARRGAADRRRRQRRTNCASMTAATICCACRPASEGKRLAAALADLKPGIAALLAHRRGQMGAELAGGSNNWALSRRAHLDRTADRRRRSAPRAGNAEHVCAGASRLRRVRRHRPHRARRAGLSAFRPYRECRLVRHPRFCRHPRSLCRAVRATAARHYRFKGEMLPVTQSPRNASGCATAPTSPSTSSRPSTDPSSRAIRQTARRSRCARCSSRCPINRSTACCRCCAPNRSSNCYEATRGFGLMDHNVVAGDTPGKIGHRVRALVPARPALQRLAAGAGLDRRA